jgi:GxxExxY protein
LAQRGIPFERQVAMPVAYKGAQLDCGYRLDIVLADEIIVELKAVESIAPIHEAQILSYLRISGKPLGYLINFNVRLLKNGIHRFANFPKAP